MPRKQLVLVFKPGSEKVSRKDLSSLFELSNNVYTAASLDVPVWLKAALDTLSDVAEIIEPELDSGRYSLFSLPHACGKSSAMTALRLKYSERLVAQYWLDPSMIKEIDLLTQKFKALHTAIEQLEDVVNTFAEIYADVAPENSEEAAFNISEIHFRDAYCISFSKMRETHKLIKNRLIGLVQRNVANPDLFSTSS